MGASSVQKPGAAVWRIAARDHNVVTRAELVALGFSPRAIEHRVAKRRLHPKARGVYAVGTPELTREGRWMVAIKSCGEQAVLSHLSAAVLYGIRKPEPSRIHVTVPRTANPRRRGVKVHRREAYARRKRNGIPVTTVERTIIDCAATLARDDIEQMVNQATIKRLTDPEKLRRAAGRAGHLRGAAKLRRILDIATFRFTRSALERAFIPIALRAGLPRPLTAQMVNGYEVDFYWPELGLVVETDSLTFHRTAQTQAADLKRDQVHLASGLHCCRFSHGHVNFEARRVEAVLRAVGERLAAQCREHAVPVDVEGAARVGT
jgi:very-short-patch-repair endonuclease